MNIERMKMAIERLNNLPEDRGRTFDYTTFLKQKDCGTLACAGGELALYPPFMEMGLAMNKVGVISFNYVIYKWNTDALAEFLDISDNEAWNAFIMLSNILGIEANKITAKHVADYLQKLLDAELAKTQTGEVGD
jgi:hypothetical protein